MVADYKYGFDGMSQEQMLEKMKKGWVSGKGTKCGAGSSFENTSRIRTVLPDLVKNWGIRSVNDAGAGDLNWVRKVKWDVEYQAFDLVPRHEDVQQFDITREVLPAADLILCRHVLNHLSPKLAIDALENFKESGSRYLLMTNCKNQRDFWKKHNVPKIGTVLGTWQDVDKWELELYPL